MLKTKPRRFIWIVTITILGLALAVPAINWAWYAHMVPAEFSGTHISGTFKSDQHFLVSGHWFAKQPMKSNPSCGEPFEIEAILYYNLWSLYHPGQTVRTRLVCTIGDRQIQGSNFGCPVEYERVNEFVGRKMNHNEPLITFVGIAADTIVGSYQTVDPDDLGHFIMTSHEYH